ncbi:MAG TPA: hypothetical protein VM889_03390 [Candidatus Thermoplasmatota archaeon]|nr:hypothetical protein [Candidatus Thermoplasmatota archaeon]
MSLLGWRTIAVLATALLVPLNASASPAVAPSNFLVQQSNGFAVLSWDATESTTYRVFVGTNADNLGLVGTTSALTFDANAGSGETWYAVGAVDASGALGPVAFSNAGATKTGQCVSVSKSGGVGISIKNCVTF